jgi:hypothetical protein
MIFNVSMRNSLAEIRLVSWRSVIGANIAGSTDFETIDAKVQKALQFASIPFTGSRVAEIHDRQSWLPQVPSSRIRLGCLRDSIYDSLPNTTAFPLDKVSALHSFFKNRRELGDVGIDCETRDEQAFVSRGQ